MVNGTYVLRRLLVVIPTSSSSRRSRSSCRTAGATRATSRSTSSVPGATEAGVEQIVQEFHLDEPMHTRYLLWLSDALRGDLGRSAIQGQEVSDGDHQRDARSRCS